MLLRSKSKVMRNPLKIQLFRERLSDERSVMPTGQDRKVVWVFTGILHISVEEISVQICILPVKH